MLSQFRHLYPHGSLISELLLIHEGLYLVRVQIIVNNNILATALAGARTIEIAEDEARSRALKLINLPNVNFSNVSAEYSPTALTQPVELPTSPLSNHQVPKRAIELPTNISSQSDCLEEPTILHDRSSDSIKPNLLEINSSAIDQTTDPLPVLQSTDLSPTISPTSSSINESTPPLPAPSHIVHHDMSDVMAKINLEIKRLNWGNQQGRDYLIKTYGVKTRQHLTEEQLIDLLARLESLEKNPN